MFGLTPSPIATARRKAQRGTTAILFTMLSTLFVIPIAGLAIDGAIMYLMKAKLSAAVDAAALATARGLNVGQTLQAQENSATTTGDNYFAANLPTGTMGMSVTGLSITFPTSPIPYTMQVNVQATISVPLTFMRLLHVPTASFSATGQASRRVSNIILVLDRSYSIQLGSNCSNLITSAESFVNYFVDGMDTMGLVDFQASAKEDFQAATNFKSGSPNINSYISQLQCTGYTNTAQALAQAYNRLQVINQPLADNVIVLFTDGNADTISAKFPLRSSTTSDTRYNWQPVYSTNPSTTTVNKSTCTSTLQGVIINLPGGLTGANDTGGVYADTQQPISWNSPYETQGAGYPYPAAELSGTNCAFTSTSVYSYPTNSLAMRNDVANIPAHDDSQYQVSFINSYWTQSSDYMPSGPYAGNLRVDTVQSVNDAALSDADNMAHIIRTGTASTGANITATIYTIGLGNPPYEVINSTFLERIANDPRASGYDSSQPTGLFILCSSAGLQSAFEEIASQILRLSK